MRESLLHYWVLLKISIVGHHKELRRKRCAVGRINMTHVVLSLCDERGMKGIEWVNYVVAYKVKEQVLLPIQPHPLSCEGNNICINYYRVEVST